MAGVTVTKEPDGLASDGVDACVDCRAPTLFWANDGEYPLCQLCAKTHEAVAPVMKEAE